MIDRYRLVFKAIAVSALLAVSQAAFPQIRDYVPIVRPVFHEGTVDFFTKLETSLREDGYDGMADYVKSYKAGTFGSGFVYVAPDGKNYVITNRHVVSQADKVTLEFEKADGSQVVYKNCQVTALDEEIDIALISFPPDARPFKAGLALTAASVEDGAEVWTAGYPGLGTSPSWQLGKGNVSNAALKLADLVDPAVTTLIQHSAQVDPGNSGGPLLQADAKSPGGYKVVGLNTWKVSNRQATNISIPVTAIRGFISATLENKAAKTRRESLEARGREYASLVAASDIPYGKMARFVSYAYVSAEGEKAFRSVISSAPTDVRSSILEVFSGYSPVEGMRLAIAYKIGYDMKKQPVEAKDKKKKADAKDAAAVQEDKTKAPFLFSSIDGDPDSDIAPVPVRFSKAGAEFNFSWIIEHGKWRIRSTSLDAIDAENEKQTKKNGGTADFAFGERPYLVSLQARASIPFDDESIFLLGGTLNASLSPYWGIQIDVGGGRGDYYDGVDTVPYNAFAFFVGTFVRLPLSFGGWALAPYAGLNAGFFGNMTYESAFCGNYDIGVEGVVGEYDGAKLSLDLHYPHMAGIMGGIGTGPGSDLGMTSNVLSFGAGIAY